MSIGHTYDLSSSRGKPPPGAKHKNQKNSTVVSFKPRPPSPETNAKGSSPATTHIQSRRSETSPPVPIPCSCPPHKNPRANRSDAIRAHLPSAFPPPPPNRVFKYLDPVRRRGTIAKNVSAAGPNKNGKTSSPIRFASRPIHPSSATPATPQRASSGPVDTPLQTSAPPPPPSPASPA